MENSLIDFIKTTTERTDREIKDARNKMDEIAADIKTNAENELKKLLERW